MNVLTTLRVRESANQARQGEPIRIGVPLPRGVLREPRGCSLADPAGRQVPAQFAAQSRWSDGSIRWLLLDACVDAAAGAEQTFTLNAASAGSQDGGLVIDELTSHVRIDTGRAVFEVPLGAGETLTTVSCSGTVVLDARGVRVYARGAGGAVVETRFTDTRIEEQGPVRCSILRSGVLLRQGRELARLAVRLIFCRDSAALRLECQIWNPQAAVHVGGLWDLGDAGSIRFEDLSVELQPARAPAALEWQSAPGAWSSASPGPWALYQDSSGGPQWNSPNHIDAEGKSTVTFRGFRVLGENGAQLAAGERATPAVRLLADPVTITATVEKFWQNFPKALRWSDGVLGVGLFPRESAHGFELQGGEKKRHVVSLDFDARRESRAAMALHAPLQVLLESGWVASTQAVGHGACALPAGEGGYARYLDSLLEGPHAVTAKREIIDEYGWRNFGDLYADHEAVRHQGSEPFVSHYNNQYDFVYGAALQFLSSADARWHELMLDAARHLIDIDIYHVREDKPAFSGGMFWHTDHYQPAKTCTHRTYSRRNAQGPYGGGPSSEHNYTSGLLLYHYLSGDPEAKAAILELTDWVLRMDDGALTLWALFDPAPTGAATATVDPAFQKPGRGAGNSINALMDAYALSGRREYLAKAEEFIQRCIHPRDDIGALGLLEPEFRWSYLVFLQVLAKYLDLKRQLGETDYAFHYARDALLHYATWMAQQEVPYKDVLDKVLLPTETWPAQDIRKSHVLYLAALHAPEAARAQLRSRAQFFFGRCLADLLTFPTAYLTRPQVLLCVYASQCAGAANAAAIESAPHGHAFGEPRQFLTQRQRALPAFGARLRTTMREAGRAFTGAFRKARLRS